MRAHTRHASLAFALILTPPGLALAGDPTACDAAIVQRVLQHGRAPAGGQVRASACVRLGGPQHLMAVAVAHEPEDYDWRTAASLPVHVAWVDERTKRVVASTRADIGEDAATQVDAQSFEWRPMPGLGRPAAALQVRDFILQSAMDGDSGPTWTLFVADGSRLEPVVGPAMLWFAQCDRACRDSDETQRRTKTLAIAPGRETHNGLRDLDATLADSTKTQRTHLQLRFDGKRYAPDVSSAVDR
jgi:hypothetical protein